jgi:carboxylate-amine ligase
MNSKSSAPLALAADSSATVPPTSSSDSAAAPAKRNDELCFHPSPEPAFGVEVELQILDRETGDLAPGAVRILKACEEDGVAGTAAELMQSMIEVRTGVCRNVDEARDQLFARIGKVRNIASSLGYELAMASTHPFHRTTTSTVFPAERYEKILDRLEWLTYQRVMFGLHVHVGVPDGDAAIGVINLLVRYLPHLIALSANSPFWQGVDTGLASSRIALYRLLPHAGLPQYFADWKEFRNYCRVMLDCQTIGSFKDIYWDIRPRPDFGTVEVRVCDIPSTLTETLRLVALVRSLRARDRRRQVPRRLQADRALRDRRGSPAPALPREGRLEGARLPPREGAGTRPRGREGGRGGVIGRDRASLRASRGEACAQAGPGWLRSRAWRCSDSRRTRCSAAGRSAGGCSTRRRSRRCGSPRERWRCRCSRGCAPPRARPGASPRRWRSSPTPSPFRWPT